ncbi:MAG: tail protein X [Candidatus Limiplasma sp.]|nr:tail protein X [Candidatus Limiplasma sp.]
MATAATYTTVEGDAWDLIAYKVYGAERYADHLMAHNFPLLDTFIFDSGVVIKTPPLPTKLSDNVLPPWRRS